MGRSGCRATSTVSQGFNWLYIRFFWSVNRGEGGEFRCGYRASAADEASNFASRASNS